MNRRPRSCVDALMLRAPALILLTLALPAAAHAKCMSARVSVWPAPDAALATEGALILVEGYGNDQDRVRALEAHQVALVAAGQRIPLEIVQRNPGEYRLTQIALRPTQPLVDGVRYRLQLPFETTAHAWTARATAHATPTWTAAPTVLRHAYTEYGCGPGAEVHLAVPVTGAALLAVSVEDGRSAPRRWLFPADEAGQLRLGHGMCGGAFALEEGAGFSAEIVAISATGQRAPAPGPHPEFHGPGPKDSAD